MKDPSAALSYAVRPRVILKYLGQIAFVLALWSMVPLLVSLLAGGIAAAAGYLPVIAVLLLLAFPSGRQPAPAYIQANEALTVIALAFLLASLVFAYPLMGAGLSPGEALFESISGLTTTGLTTLPAVEGRPAAFLFGRAWLQWSGALGFVVLLVALLTGNGIAARRLTEPYGSETMLTTARTHARRMLAVYLTLTLTGFAVVWVAHGNAFTALVHVLASVSTGGFSSYDQSLGGIGTWTARYAIIGVALLGAIPLPLYLRGARAKILRDKEFQTLILAVLTVGAALAVLLHLQGEIPWGDAARHGFLMGISAQTTTGYSTIDPANAGDAARLIMIAAMFVGGGLGSTAGGIKLLRLLIVLELVRAALRRASLAPHAVANELRLGDKKIDDDDIQRTLVLVVLYIGVTLVSWLAFLVYGYPPLDALFEVVSAVGTVGLSTGITSAALEPPLRAVLCADMLVGRLEILAFLVLMYPRNWFGNRVD